MKERGVLFSAPMVRAVLDESKTQTRRVIKPHPDDKTWFENQADGTVAWHCDGEPCCGSGVWEVPHHTGKVRCPYGVPGDRLWVRETWAGPLVDFDLTESEDFAWQNYKKPEFCRYAADGGPRPEFMDADDNLRQRWTPGIHMFRWASRITLEVTGVRVERLNDISRGDAMAEGCPFPNMAQGPDPRQWYADLWDSINSAGSWGANPYVWVVEFRRAT